MWYAETTVGMDMSELKLVRLGAEPKLALSAVIPCYNEVDNLAELHRRTSAACRKVVGDSYEILLVNDGSTDGTLSRIYELAAVDPYICGVDLARNYGHQIALSAGLELCRGQRIFILDADLQDPPELLEKMMQRMDEGYDVVFGVRQVRKGETWFKIATASAFYRILGRLSDIPIAANAGDFRLMNRRSLEHLNAMPERFRFVRGMISWIGLRQVAFSYSRDPRFAGKTHYPLRKMVALAVDAMTSFSIAPLRLASHLGLAFGFLGLALLVFAIGSWLSGNVLPGWTSLAAIMLILGSVQLFVLGVFGEYLGRMYIETKRRPLYIVNEVRRSADSLASLGEPADG
jgi:dolichol-phosphate mannosyltransferase